MTHFRLFFGQILEIILFYDILAGVYIGKEVV